ncbi:hypothetical protein PRIPAC_83058 [Pristionchus pacificus]|uniref:Uncharacterized protein n=1 Tax=Pristionchus pacificus TaxID=54126 RepID=A0A2A6BE61_PRIPA|nr:hypothetical protein PRIPAC_83058 [Pristionchus pacificus]|eukprot:PDM64101.1 hypothetical protein PRIPAC_54345 [Pristionchus pacificus]
MSPSTEILIHYIFSMEGVHPFEEIDGNGKTYWLPFMVYPQRLNQSFRVIYNPYLIAVELLFHLASIFAYIQAILLFSRSNFHINAKIIVNLGFVTSILYILHRIPLAFMELDVIPFSGPTDDWIVRITLSKLFYFDIMFFFQINIIIERAAALLLRRLYTNIVSNTIIVIILILNISIALYCCHCKVDVYLRRYSGVYIHFHCYCIYNCYLIFLVINRFNIKEAEKAHREAQFLDKRLHKSILNQTKRMNYVFGVSTLAISIILFSLAIPPFLLEESSQETIEITKIVFNLFCSISFGFTVAVMNRFMKDGKLSIVFGIDTNRMVFHIIFVISFGEVINCYFSCVYYRRNIILPDGARFRYTGWSKLYLLLGIRIIGFVVYSIIYFLLLQIDTPIEEIPPSALWTQSKTCSIFLKIDWHLYVLAFVMLGWGMPLFTVISLIVRELSHELKHGMINASSSTKRRISETGCHFSLTPGGISGIVPGIVYILPILSEFVILLYSTIVESKSISPRIISMISAILFNLFSLHTFVHSITIFACTPSYRRSIIGIIKRKKIPSPSTYFIKVSELTHKVP